MQSSEQAGEQPRLQRLRKIEAEMLLRFQQEKIYETEAPQDYSNLQAEEKNDGKFMCTFPYPYMNGYLHLGHGYSMSKCEFQSRYQKQLGKRVLWPFGFHCTGMPIQAAANRLKREITQGKTVSVKPTEEEVKKNPKMAKVDPTQYEILKQVGMTDEMIPEFQDPNHWLNFFPPKGKEDLLAFGVNTDFRRSFLTTQKNPYYDSFIRWQFTHLKANNKITYAKRFTIFSELDQQPCADHDRAKGEGVGPQEYTGIKIQLLEMPEVLAQWTGQKVFLVAATLRPETMFGQTNCYVLPEGEYGLYEMKNNEFFVISERAARNMAYQELTKEDQKYPCLAKVTGQQLIGKRLKTPLTSYEHVYALPMPTISMTKGTGIVTSVPSDSPDDYAMLRDLQTKKGLREKYLVEEEWCVPFEPIPIIEIPGLGNLAAKKCVEDLKIQSHKDADKLKEAKDMCYLEGFYKGIMLVGVAKGQRVEEAKPVIREHLLKEGLAITYYEPEGEVVSRSGDQCIVALKFQWLLNYGEEQWKNDVKKHITSENFNTYNVKTQQEFEHILEWLKEWGCSRTAGLGTHLPWDEQFVIESLSDSTIYMAYYTVAHLLQGGVLDGSEVGPLGVKAQDLTVSAWDFVFLGKPYNASECPNVTEEQLKKMRHEFEYWYPMDLRVSGKDLIRNHLTMSLYNHAAIWKDNMEQRMVRNYFCNGYLMLNGQKMSKSTGNFMTLRDCINKFGVEASRIGLADAGDTLDDANFDETVANAAILKLFILEQWMVANCPKQVDFAAHSKSEYDTWDSILSNELTRIIDLVNRAYVEMKFKIVIKHAFNELLSLKEAYLIAKGGKPNPFVLFRYLETLLLLLNPIIPHFCQYQWQTVLVPALNSCKNLPRPPADLLINQGWPATGIETSDPKITAMFSYLQEVKSIIRLSQAKAQAGGKKAKKAVKGAPAEEKTVIENCVLFVGHEFPEYQKRVLQILNSYEFVDNTIQGNEYIAKIREEVKGKEGGLAMKFAAFVLEEGKNVGKEQALQLKVPFDEISVIENNLVFLFENMPTIKSVKVMLNMDSTAEATYPDSKQVREAAVPGKPVAHFF